ncbi:helix-hairpin-helix domain-containing protein [Deltaproteobacteria bacterium]|nr:helix-hairpin-helix domain-containing protein [Deltaproteobacteria bacterium]
MKKVVCVWVLVLVVLLGSMPVLALQRVDVNTATIEQLVEVKGIGEVLAQRIIEYRQEHNKFNSLEELNNVKGVGSKKLEKLRPHLTLSGK